MIRKPFLALFIATVVAVPSAFGTVAIGDKPKLDFKSTDGTAVSMDTLKGRIVVVDFWATWCGPCMEMADEMVAINKEYGGKGLQMVGISLDQSRPALDKIVKEKGFAWPQYFDGKGWENAVWKQWGENGIPFTVLLSPEGSVLWKGHPGSGLKQQIDKAFKEHPPQLVDAKTLAKTNDLLSQIEAKS